MNLHVIKRCLKHPMNFESAENVAVQTLSKLSEQNLLSVFSVILHHLSGTRYLHKL